MRSQKPSSAELLYLGDDYEHLTTDGGPVRKNEVRLVTNFVRMLVRMHATKVVQGLSPKIIQKSDAARDDAMQRTAQGILDEMYRQSQARIVDKRAAMFAAIDAHVWFKLRWRDDLKTVTFAPVRRSQISDVKWNEDYTEPLALSYTPVNGTVEKWDTENEFKYPFVPFVYLPNRVGLTHDGENDVDDLRGMQRFLNERMSTLLWLMRVDGNPVTIAKKIDEVENLRVGPGEIWKLTNPDSDAKTLEFLSAQLIEAHINITELLKRWMLNLADTPVILLGHSAGEGNVSGTEMELKLEPYVRAIEDKRELWTVAAQQRNSKMLAMYEIHAATSFKGNTNTIIRFAEILSARITQRINDASKMMTEQAMSRKTAMGYTATVDDPEAEFAEILKEREMGIGTPAASTQPTVTVASNNVGQPLVGGKRLGAR